MDDYKLGFNTPTDKYSYKAKKGLSEQVVRDISRLKNEPEWMLTIRLSALKQYESMPIPKWGADLSQINWEDIHYYLRPVAKAYKTWEEVPDGVRQVFDAIGVPQAEKSMLAGVGGQYDCLAKGTLIPTNNGIKKIEDILQDDSVLSMNEESRLLVWQKVVATLNKGKRKTYKVVTQGGREIVVTHNHPFYSLLYEKEVLRQRGKYHLGWRYLSDLKKGDFVALTVDYPEYGIPYPVPTLVDLHIDESLSKLWPTQTTSDLMWILGFYLGDGFMSYKLRNGRQVLSGVDLAIPEKEPELRVLMKQLVNDIFGYQVPFSRTDRIRLSSVSIAKLIINLGFSGSAFTKSIPGWVFSLPKDQRLSFLGGYFDADGGIRTGKNNALVYTSVSKTLLEQVKMLAISCGLNVSHVWHFVSKQTYKGEIKERAGYRIQLSGHIEEVDVRMERKRARMQRRQFIHRFRSSKGTTFKKYTSDNLGFTKILLIEEAEEQEVYDISVEGFHNFVANGLVVHNSEVIYHSLKKTLAKRGVIFLSMDEGLKQYPDIVKEYFGKIVPYGDNKLAALNTAVWSGGSFVYLPKGVVVDLPLQAYFRINAENAGQFERTLIVAEEESSAHYVEGCSAPAFTSASLHAAVVEVVVKEGAKVRYTTVQNWYKTVYNLVTKRATVARDGRMEWVDCNLGSKITMKYPSCFLMGERAHGEMLSLAVAGEGQHQDAGAKMFHLAPNTTSRITSKSISKNGGRSSYRGQVKIIPTATGSRSKVVCDALILDNLSRSDTYPNNQILCGEATLEHEAYVSKIGEEQILYLMSRGLTQKEAEGMIIRGFLEPVIQELPMEYAVELNRMVKMEMIGSVG